MEDNFTGRQTGHKNAGQTATHDPVSDSSLSGKSSAKSSAKKSDKFSKNPGKPAYSKAHPKAHHKTKGNGTSGETLYAALDLGTNNCRLLIVAPDGKNFRVIDSFSRIVRLGEGLDATGRLSEPAMARTLAALRICAGKIRHHRVTRVRCVATEACRNAENGAEFISNVEKETRLRMDVIGGRDEAELAAIGCGALFDRKRRHAIVFDIGGGSTEITRLTRQRGRYEMRDTESLKLGVVRLSERYDGTHMTPDTYRQMVDDCIAQIDDFVQRQSDIKDLRELQLIGTSGTITTLAAVQLGLKRYDRSKVDGCVISRSAIKDVIRRLVRMSHSELADHPCIGPERADLVLAGCAVLEAMLSAWPVPRIIVADRGLREGILLRLIRKDQRQHHPKAHAKKGDKKGDTKGEKKSHKPNENGSEARGARP